MRYSKGKRSHGGSKLGQVPGEEDMVNLEDSSKLYGAGSAERNRGAPFGKRK